MALVIAHMPIKAQLIASAISRAPLEPIYPTPPGDIDSHCSHGSPPNVQRRFEFHLPWSDFEADGNICRIGNHGKQKKM